MNLITKQEEEKRFLELVQIVGKQQALFCCCAIYDVPYDDEIEAETWEEYNRLLLKKKGEAGTFKDGITDIMEIARRVEPDEERWLAEWGIGDEEKPYTEDDYIRLDELYATYTSRLRGSGGMDEWQEDTLRTCSKMRLTADKALAKGDKDSISIASTLNKMIQENLSSEQLRKKDAKPVEQARIDGIVEALARKTGCGIDLSMENAVAICSKWLASHHYPMTRDAADHMLLAIINCTRSNNDMPEIDELPETAKFDKKFSTMFADEPNENEDEAFDYLNLPRESDRPKGK